MLLIAGYAKAGDLPSFDDFLQIDRMRRLTGQMQTAELLKVTRMDPELIECVVEQGTNDAVVAWGAAELMSDWPQRRAMFEKALELTSNSVPIALRFACAAARQRDYDLALQWAEFCKAKDADNLVPWLVESWVLVERQQRQQLAQALPDWVRNYRDYTVVACQMRIRVLEQAGYSAYSARRLGFKPDSDALLMASELCRSPVEEMLRKLLRQTAESLERHRQFLVNELVGQTIERTLFASRTDDEALVRKDSIAARREQIRQQLVDMERNVVEFASESQMVKYFDDVLALGEEEAMRKLAGVVRKSAPPVSAPTGN